MELRGADIPAQTYYVDTFRSYGWVLWDNGWYSGHFQVAYSILFPPLGAAVGLYGAAILCAAVSAWAFARLVTNETGERNSVPVLLYASGTAVAVAIGQLAFLAGVAAALLALLATRHRHVAWAVVFAVSCSLFSELAALLLVGAFIAWAVTATRGDRQRIAVVGLFALAPLVAQIVLLPPLGPFPFAFVDLLVLECVCALAIALLPGPARTMRLGLALYGMSGILVFLVPNPLGGNLGRGVLYFAPALFAHIASILHVRSLAFLVIPMLVWQYVPAGSSLSPDASAQPQYFRPVVEYVERQPVLGRVEIPFTSGHWEAAYVAPRVPLARGWLRQLDTRDNPIFYAATDLTSKSYHQWLLDNGVTWVALGDVPLDYSAIQEAQLLRLGQPYLHLVWRDRHWRIWKVVDTPGLVSGPVTVTSLRPDGVGLMARAAGTALLRVHYTTHWTVTTGDACVLNEGGWTGIVIHRAGAISLSTSLLPNHDDCDAARKSRSSSAPTDTSQRTFGSATTALTPRER
jgi:hypothetical protein